ncbi:MAG: TonB-dependent receptor [candidate division Zixibacteria bacterium]|nr:TonB-dependent receptor [candidate division Zixibacteria bacterium]
MLMLALCSLNVTASEFGVVTGTLTDAATGEALIGVSVYLEGTSLGAISDIDGSYTIKKIIPGTYSLRAQLVGYSPVTVTGITVKADEDTDLNFQLSVKTEALMNTITVTARAMQNTEASMLKHRQASKSVTDAVSSEQISRSGSGDAAEAVKSVVGASVVGGKYVFVRGLGDRYSNTQLNGAPLPSADPDKQSVQMDLIPSSLLDNIVVQKTFTPDKPGNFAGGSINLGTKDYPDKRSLIFSTSTGYNSETTFQSDFLTHNPSSRDWLGYNGGSYDVPQVITGNPDLQELVPENRTFITVRGAYPDSVAYYEPILSYMDESAESWNSEMSPKTRDVPLNQSHSIAYGDKLNLFDRPLGVVASLSYSRKFSSRDGFQGQYSRTTNTNPSLTPLYEFSDSRGVEEVLWGGLGTIVYGIHRNHKLSYTFMHNRNGESDNRSLEGPWQEYSDDGVVTRNFVLGYTERKLTSQQFAGNHSFFKDHIRAEWKASFSSTSQNDPDLRFFTDEVGPAYQLMEDPDSGDIIKVFFPDSFQYVIQTNRYRAPQRLWRTLDEDNRDISLDLTVPLGTHSKFKTGGAFLKVNRNSTETMFQYVTTVDSYYKQFNGDVDAYASQLGFDSVHAYLPPNATDSNYQYFFSNLLSERSEDRNQYDGYQKVFGIYGMIELPLSSRLAFVGGARYETTDMSSETLEQKLDSTKTAGSIDEGDVLPSLNLIYKIGDRMNLRASFGRTLARPTLREVTPAASQEFGSGNFFIGNDSLTHTKINNFDLRWEWFKRPGEVTAISAFYKRFENPIELSIYGPNKSIRPENSDKATVVGLEFEFRNRLDELSSRLANFTLGGNLTLVHSAVEMTTEELAYIKDEENGYPDASDTRPMWGQSPYLVNFDLAYDNIKTGTSASLFYNVFGERLTYNSEYLTPDVYELPRQDLDIMLSQKLFGSPTLKLRIRNILNTNAKFVYRDKIAPEGSRVDDRIYEEYKRGRTYSLGISYAIW